MSDDDKAEATPVSKGSGTSSTASSTSSSPVTEKKSPGQKQRSVGAHDINACIKQLKQQQADMRVERKQVSKQLRNEEKRRSRLKKRARLLTDADLVCLLKLRKDPDHEPDAPSGGGSSSSSCAITA